MQETIKLIRINQLGAKPIYVGKIKYSQLQGKASLTKRETSGDKEYQRETDKSRISKISDFLKSHDSAISPFPTPLVLALQTEQDLKITLNEGKKDKETIHINDYLKLDEPNPFLINNNLTSDIDESTNDFYELYIPSTTNNIFIVDGQHRFLGIKKYFEDNPERSDDIELVVTFLLNYDTYEQAEVFANINFKQKPVNKSLYYDIFGSMPGKNEFTFTHYLIKTINNNPPLNGLVKMLGKGDGIVSLAFMVETINKQILGYKGKIYDIYMEYEEIGLLEQELESLQKEKENNSKLTERIGEIEKKLPQLNNYKKLPQLFMDYLAFYNERFNEYSPKKIIHKNYSEEIFSSYSYEFFMFKATGMFGILKILNDLFESNIINIEDNKNQLFSKLDNEMKLVLENKEFFFLDERLIGAGSASLQGKFYKMLHSAIFHKTLEKH